MFFLVSETWFALDSFVFLGTYTGPFSLRMQFLRTCPGPFMSGVMVGVCRRFLVLSFSRPVLGFFACSVFLCFFSFHLLVSLPFGDFASPGLRPSGFLVFVRG